jgi:hypothetical protein
MPTSQNNRAPMSKLFTSLANIFKAADSEAMRDLSEALDTPSVSDMFNSGDHGNCPRTPTGPAESASGSGAERMIQTYSPDTQQGNALTAAYTQMGEALAFLNTRMEKSERSVKAIATLLATAMGKGKEAAEMFDAEDSEDDDDDKKDKDAAEKGRVRVADVGGVVGLMQSLMSVSKANVPDSLVTPPNLAVVRKAGTSIQDVLDADDGSTFPFHARMELASIQSALSNLDGGMMRATHLNNLLKRASEPTREVLMKAGISF